MKSRGVIDSVQRAAIRAHLGEVYEVARKQAVAQMQISGEGDSEEAILAEAVRLTSPR